MQSHIRKVLGGGRDISVSREQELLEEQAHLRADPYCERVRLEEAVIPSGAWGVFRQAIRDAVRSQRGVPSEGEVRREVDAKFGQMTEFVKDVLPGKPSDADVQRAAKIVQEEMGLAEALPTGVSPLQYILVSLEAAWKLFAQLIKSGGFTFPLGFTTVAIPAWAIALCLGVVAWAVTTFAVLVLRDQVNAFRGWVYRTWKYEKLALGEVESAHASLLRLLGLDEEYVFVRDVPSTDLFDPSEQPSNINQNVPFKFKGFVRPRWMETQFMHVVPLSGRLRDEERIVLVEYAPHIRKMSGEVLEDQE